MRYNPLRMLIRQQLPQYAQLMRLHKPIGILLLLWPTLWGLWLASEGIPDKKILFIFIAGVILMRSTGCVINDFADRNFDGSVRRTRERPLVKGKVSLSEAAFLILLLSGTAFALVLSCNNLTVKLSFLGASLAAIYPFLKRITHLPQLGLGIAFSWGVPMAFAAVNGSVKLGAWFLFLTSAIWPLVYDTMYAIVDREDDVKIGVRSTAILFDDMDKFIIGLLQLLFVTMLVIVGLMFRLRFVYYTSLFIVLLLFCYQQWLIKNREPSKCFRAFINNHWVGLFIFLGIFLSYHPSRYLLQ